MNLLTITKAKLEDEWFDTLFDDLRNAQFLNHNDALHKNYSLGNFVNCLAYSICFENNVPVMCATIAHKSCWPDKTYRILNRLWKPNDKRIKFPRQMSQSFGEIAKSQIKWIKDNLECDLMFISRETSNWQNFVISEFDRQFSIKWKSNTNKYLTCDNENCHSCWQNIIYIGNEEVLEHWKHRQNE
jgi:hypothetical protein